MDTLVHRGFFYLYIYGQGKQSGCFRSFPESAIADILLFIRTVILGDPRSRIVKSETFCTTHNGCQFKKVLSLYTKVIGSHFCIFCFR